MGFKATEAVEALTYDFSPHADAQGIIPEPSSKQIEDYRQKIINSVKDSGLDPSATASGKVDLAKMDELMSQASSIEEASILATADLTGIAPNVLRGLPYRVKTAFLGWIMGEFFSPEV